MSKSLIIPDLHLKTAFADQIIKNEGKYDKIIWGSDIFDQFGDTVEENRLAAIWFKEKLEDERNIFLNSNHVHSYQFGSMCNEALCSGFTHEKNRAIHSVLTPEDFYKQKTFHVEDGILFTHAGLSKRFLDFMVAKGHVDEFEYTLENIAAKLDIWTEMAYAHYRIGHGHPLFRAGFNRGGYQETGGIIWADLGEFETIPNIRQVFFHSPITHPTFKFTREDKQAYAIVGDKKVKWTIVKKYLKNGFGLDLDTHLNHYATLENGTLKIYKVLFDKEFKPREPREITGKELIGTFKI
jgi:hypothetical protein